MAQTHTPDGSREGMFCSAEGAVARVRSRSTDADVRALEYTIAADGDEAVDVRLRQPLPESVDLADVGFPGQCAEHWEYDGSALCLEDRLEPEGAVHTAWGLAEGVDPTLDPPTLESAVVESEADAWEPPSESVTNGVTFDSGDAGVDDAGGHTPGETRDAAALEAADAPATDEPSPSDGPCASDETPASDEPSPTDETAPSDGPSSTDDASLELEFPDQEDANSASATGEPDDDDGLGGFEPAQVEPTSTRVGADETAGGDAGALTAADASGGSSTTADATTAATGDSSGERASEGARDGGTDGDAGPADRDDVHPADSAVGEGPDTGARADDVGDRPLVLQLVAELKSEALSEDHRKALRDALDARLSESTNAFVEHHRKKLQRRTDRLESEVEALEESVEEIYGVTADAGELRALKRAITDLDDAKADGAALRSVAEDVEGLRTRAAEAEETIADIQDATDSLSEAAASTDDLAALRDDVEATEEALHDALEDLQADLRALEERVASSRRLDVVAEDLDDLRADAATEAGLTDLREELDLARDEADEQVADVRDLLRRRHNATTSELADLRDALEAEYSTDAELREDIDRRVYRSVGTLALFGLGAAGIGATIPLAVTGSAAAAVTFLGGLGAIAAWRHDRETDGGWLPEERPAVLDRF